MLRILKSIALSTLSLLLVSTVFINPISADFTPYVSVIPCDKELHLNIRRVGGTYTEVVKYTGRFLQPGSTGSVSSTQSFSVSNSRTFNLIPELISFGQSSTYSASLTSTTSFTNTSSQFVEIVGFGVYYNYSVDVYIVVGSGTCNANPQVQTYKVYAGTSWGLNY